MMGQLKQMASTLAKKRDAEITVNTENIPEIGDVFDSLGIMQQLGHGSFGEVYKLDNGEVVKVNRVYLHSNNRLIQLIPFKLEDSKKRPNNVSCWHQLCHELKMNADLKNNAVSGFQTFKEVQFTRGAYPLKLQDMWISNRVRKGRRVPIKK